MKKRTKRLLVVILILVCLAGATAIIYTAFFRPPPVVMEVEGFIPEGPDILIVTRDMAGVWEEMGEDAVTRGSRFLSLINATTADLGPVRGAITDTFDLEEISPELLFYLLGYESALAVYPSNDDPAVLFVSRVHPTVVFLEQFIIFIDEQMHIDRIPFRDMTVREISIESDEAPTLFYTFDNDLLVFSSDRHLFESALDLLTGEETASTADEPIRQKLERFRAEKACVWGFSREGLGGLVKDDAADPILLHLLGGGGAAKPSPVFFCATWEGESLVLNAARDTDGDAPRTPPAAPEFRYINEELLSLIIGEGLLTAGEENAGLFPRLFPHGCSAILLAGETPGVLHPAIGGAAGPDADSLLKNTLEASGAPTSLSLVDDVTMTTGVLHGEGIVFTADDGLLIIGRDAGDILAHRRFIQNNTVDPHPTPGIILSLHLRPAALIEAPAGVDVFTSLLSECGFSGSVVEEDDALSYRELAQYLSAWETADAITWTDDGQTNLTIILSRKGDQP
ncbi:MAG: hypothetical protein JW885_08740 [Deltaproteobacteria bacterium]|nr:hypothetical protein [Candidatus Zymogenaceae bacterium]